MAIFLITRKQKELERSGFQIWKEHPMEHLFTSEKIFEKFSQNRILKGSQENSYITEKFEILNY